ncbi:MAG: hypothetical protein NTV79_02305 [Candidatus Aureabacteria bacterium]|nr:hypothetical protein [Candidatus Auribacterota bacterium]
MRQENVDTVDDLFRLARAAEAEARLFYRGLRALFAPHPAVASFWDRMYEDETVHCRELLLIHAALPAAVRRLPADPQVLEKARRNALLPLRKDFRSISTLDDAFEIAHRLETSEVMVVFAFIREKYVPLTRRRSFTLSVLEDHLQRIMDFPQRFGDRAVRRMIIARRKNSN